MGTVSDVITEIFEGLQMSHRALIVLPSKLVAADLGDEARLNLKIHVGNGDGPIRKGHIGGHVLPGIGRNISKSLFIKSQSSSNPLELGCSVWWTISIGDDGDLVVVVHDCE